SGRAHGCRGDDAQRLSRQVGSARADRAPARPRGPPREAGHADRTRRSRACSGGEGVSGSAHACGRSLRAGGVGTPAQDAEGDTEQTVDRMRRKRGQRQGVRRMRAAEKLRPGAPVMSERRVSLLGELLVAIGPVSMAIYTPAMPEIVRAFGTTEAAVKMTLSLYFAGFAVAQLVCGPLSDGLGRKPVTFAFMGIYAVASLVAVLAPTVEVLIAARFFQGVGAAAGVAISRALVRDLFTNEQSARIMNLTGLILAAGPALAPTIGGLTMELAGWQAIFLIMLTAGFAIVIVVQD